jgi:hypothetical protein
VDKIPVRGKLRGKLFYGFKIAALNTNKLFRHLRGLDKVTPKVVTA